MSFYNFLNGENKDAVVLLGTLGLTRNSFQRYRDVHLNADGTKIIVYTRLGGQNRKDYKQTITNIKRHPNYLKDYDDEFDNTYAYFEFSIPDKYKDMCKKISTGKDPETIRELTMRHSKRMNIPGTDEHEKAERITKMILDAIENDDGNIHFLKF